jgi:septal ring factor EnvC (AmiA/AmiB activator)
MIRFATAAALTLLMGSRVDDQQAEVQARIEEERAELAALKSGKKDFLGLVDALERGARAQAARAAALEKEVVAARARVARSRAEQAAAEERLSKQEEAVAPRLVSLYRLTRQNQLATLSNAADFSALVRRERALSTVVGRDLEALESLNVQARLFRWRAQRLELEESVALELAHRLAIEQELAKARRAALQETVASLSKEETRVSKVVKELEQQDAALGELVREIEREGGDSHLKARKGHLPFPTKGMVEVVFGKVVNPRFNTVTVQKGIDIRAGQGEKVHAVAPGTVVYSDWLKGYGNLVIVDHGGQWHSLYAHLEGSEVEVGNEVEEGEDLGSVGDTGSLKGAYLYFELRKNGEAIDPLPWFDPETVP